MDCLVEIPFAHPRSDICIAKGSENIHIHYIYMHVYKEEQRDIDTLCYGAVTSRCNIFCREMFSHFSLLAAATPMREYLQPWCIVHMQIFLSKVIAHTLRGLQLSGFCSAIWDDINTATHTNTNHIKHICTIVGWNRSAEQWCGQFDCS